MRSVIVIIIILIVFGAILLFTLTRRATPSSQQLAEVKSPMGHLDFPADCPATDAWPQFASAKYDFAFKHLPSWSVQTLGDSGATLLVFPTTNKDPETEAPGTVTIGVEAAKPGAAARISNSADRFERVLDDGVHVVERIAIAGQRALHIVENGDSPTDPLRTELMIPTQDDQRVLHFLAVAPLSPSSDFARAVLGIFCSITFAGANGS